MILIGLTGSIGMGKTTTAKLFADAGIPGFDADAAVHKLYEKGSKAAHVLFEHFPKAIVDGAVDRRILAEYLAANDKNFALLEQLVHPLVAEARQEWTEKQRKKGTEIVLFDIPLLFEKKLEKSVDYVVLASAPKLVQQERVLARKAMTRKKFEQILLRQIPDAKKRQQADYIIETGDGIENARLQVEAILRHIKQRSIRP